MIGNLFLSIILITIGCASPLLGTDTLEEPKKEKRAFLALIEEVAKPHDIQVTGYHRDWVLILEKDQIKKVIYYYHFDNNSSGASKLCDNKNATSVVLSAHGIPNIEHMMFMHPCVGGPYVPDEGIWTDILDFARKHNYNMVCKPEGGSGGTSIIHTSNARELEDAVFEIFSTKTELSISPYYSVDREFRVIILDGDPLLTYAKTPAHLVGDGVKNIALLLADYISEKKGGGSLSSLLDTQDAKDLGDVNRIPAENEMVLLNWKHNLQKGAIANPDIALNTKNGLEALARRVAEALSINFASIDIVKFEDQFMVMEVNSGVMIKALIRQLGDQGRELAKKIYERAICSMFNLGGKK